jgi:hypothetical protein
VPVSGSLFLVQLKFRNKLSYTKNSRRSPAPQTLSRDVCMFAPPARRRTAQLMDPYQLQQNEAAIPVAIVDIATGIVVSVAAK